MKLLVKEIISKAGKLHFRRWRILSTPWFNIYVHGIYHHDEEAHMHDHPWNFYSFVLKGGFMEQTEKGYFNRSFLMGKYSKAEDVHRIYSLMYPATYTLVFTGRRKREWGYKTEKGWIDNVTYRKMKHQGLLQE